jgi:hypothetical protein
MQVNNNATILLIVPRIQHLFIHSIYLLLHACTLVRTEITPKKSNFFRRDNFLCERIHTAAKRNFVSTFQRI